MFFSYGAIYFHRFAAPVGVIYRLASFKLNCKITVVATQGNNLVRGDWLGQILPRAVIQGFTFSFIAYQG